MALDLFSPLKVVSWASAHADCPMRYTINSADEMVIIFGSGQHEFEFSLDKQALRTLNRLGTEALDKMDASAKESLGEPAPRCSRSSGTNCSYMLSTPTGQASGRDCA